MIFRICIPFCFRYEANADLIYLLNTLVDKEGKILIDGIYDEVAPLDATESELYKKIEFDVDSYRADVGTSKLRHNEDKIQLLMHRWRYPSLSIHGIEGAFSEPGQKTVIPRKVIGKFSIRIVPNQSPQKVTENVTTYLQKKWKERGSPNVMKVILLQLCHEKHLCNLFC